MQRLIRIAVVLAVLSGLVASGRAAEGTVRDCGPQGPLVGAVTSSLSRAASLLGSGDPEGAYQACRGTAQTLIREYPDCPDAVRILQGSLQRAVSLGRSSDRADEILRAFDEIVNGPFDPASGETALHVEDASDPGQGTAGSDLVYWLTDPYFLLLEIILLLLLVLLRDLRRMRRKNPSPAPLSRPFRYRVIPNGSRNPIQAVRRNAGRR